MRPSPPGRATSSRCGPSNQMVAWAVGDLAKTLGIPKENVRVISPYIGGGFGGKLFLRSDAIARGAGRARRGPAREDRASPPVHDEQHHASARDNPASALGRDRRTASSPRSAHEAWSGDLPGGGPESSVMSSAAALRGANRMTTTRLAMLDLPEGNAMRAPGDAPARWPSKSPMDEMAEKLKLDPDRVPRAQRHAGESREPRAPFSQRQLTQCFRTGAEKFGWSRRNPKARRRCATASG